MLAAMFVKSEPSLPAVGCRKPTFAQRGLEVGRPPVCGEDSDTGGNLKLNVRVRRKDLKQPILLGTVLFRAETSLHLAPVPL